uniref:Uncharacterized protein n=1 Tax=Anopheles atroparvus TaxID=41427 RepID=A0A182J5C5_ANOAO
MSEFFGNKSQCSKLSYALCEILSTVETRKSSLTKAKRMETAGNVACAAVSVLVVVVSAVVVVVGAGVDVVVALMGGDGGWIISWPSEKLLLILIGTPVETTTARAVLSVSPGDLLQAVHQNNAIDVALVLDQPFDVIVLERYGFALDYDLRIRFNEALDDPSIRAHHHLLLLLRLLLIHVDSVVINICAVVFVLLGGFEKRRRRLESRGRRVFRLARCGGLIAVCQWKQAFHCLLHLPLLLLDRGLLANEPLRVVLTGTGVLLLLLLFAGSNAIAAMSVTSGSTGTRAITTVCLRSVVV